MPYTHDVIETSMQNDKDQLRKLRGNESFLIAKKILADLPIVPTGNVTYLLTQQIQDGLFDSVSPIENVKNHWQECLDIAQSYLKGINVWQDMRK